MVKIEYFDGRHCPFIYCDECGLKITDSGKAIVLFDNSPKPPRYVHKNTCDDRKAPYWIPLDEHLRHLLNNVGLDLE